MLAKTDTAPCRTIHRMWRRLPVVPMLFGVFAAWALLGMFVASDQKLASIRGFFVAGMLGALSALLIRPILHSIGSPSTAGRFGFGCLSALLGIGFVAAIAVVPAAMVGRTVTFRDWTGL